MVLAGWAGFSAAYSRGTAAKCFSPGLGGQVLLPAGVCWGWLGHILLNIKAPGVYPALAPTRWPVVRAVFSPAKLHLMPHACACASRSRACRHPREFVFPTSTVSHSLWPLLRLAARQANTQLSRKQVTHAVSDLVLAQPPPSAAAAAGGAAPFPPPQRNAQQAAHMDGVVVDHLIGSGGLMDGEQPRKLAVLGLPWETRCGPQTPAASGAQRAWGRLAEGMHCTHRALILVVRLRVQARDVPSAVCRWAVSHATHPLCALPPHPHPRLCRAQRGDAEDLLLAVRRT